MDDEQDFKDKLKLVVHKYYESYDKEHWFEIYKNLSNIKRLKKMIGWVVLSKIFKESYKEHYKENKDYFLILVKEPKDMKDFEKQAMKLYYRQIIQNLTDELNTYKDILKKIEEVN